MRGAAGGDDAGGAVDPAVGDDCSGRTGRPRAAARRPEEQHVHVLHLACLAGSPTSWLQFLMSKHERRRLLVRHVAEGAVTQPGANGTTRSARPASARVRAADRTSQGLYLAKLRVCALTIFRHAAPKWEFGRERRQRNGKRQPEHFRFFAARHPNPGCLGYLMCVLCTFSPNGTDVVF